jgi:hypothetical protein
MKPRSLVGVIDISEIYESSYKIFRTGAANYTAVVIARTQVHGRTTVSSKSVCQFSRSWVDVDSYHTSLFRVVYFAIASVKEFLD